MNDPLLLNILRDASAGGRTYVAQDGPVPALAEFQQMAEAARRAQKAGLVDASFDCVESFAVNGLTREGLVRWAKLNIQR